MSIIAMLGAMILPIYTGHTEKAKKQVYKANCMRIGKMYQIYLSMEGLEHSKILFAQYLQEHDQVICTGNGEISYMDGKVQCSVYREVDSDEGHDGEDESVPFL